MKGKILKGRAAQSSARRSLNSKDGAHGVTRPARKYITNLFNGLVVRQQICHDEPV
jgi:hypothetical protein